MSIVISGIAVSNSNSSNEFLKKHQLFLLGCMCSKDTGCTCDLFEILWVQSDDIISWREISPARWSVIVFKKRVEIYQLISEGLKWEPITLIQPDLSVRIIRRIKLHIRIKDPVFYLLIAVITIGGATAICYLFELLDKQRADQFAMFTLQYKWIFIYSLSFILIITSGLYLTYWRFWNEQKISFMESSQIKVYFVGSAELLLLLTSF